jgi:hypothetical protein
MEGGDKGRKREVGKERKKRMNFLHHYNVSCKHKIFSRANILEYIHY